MTYSRLKCPECEADFGQEARYCDHLVDIHGIDDHEALYVKLRCDNVHPLCNCGCGNILSWNGWKKGFTSKYLRGHNATIDSCWLDKDRQAAFTEKRKRGYAEGKYKVWNAGDDANHNPKIAASAAKTSTTLRKRYDDGTLVDWRLTDPQKAKSVAEKSSQTKRRKYASGETVVWTQNKTKETDPRIATAALKQSLRYKQREAGRRISVSELATRIAKFDRTFELLSSLEEYTNRRVARLKFSCVAHGHIQHKSLAMLEESPVCYECHPQGSLGQVELYEFVKQYAVDAVCSDKETIKPKHLDVYVPNRRFAIEYDGLFYHNVLSNNDNRYRASLKLKTCDDQGITLIRVFEDEWRTKRNIVESLIRHRLGISENRLGARECEVIELSAQQRLEFFDSAHLEGNVPAKIGWGLVKNGSIVAALTLRRPSMRKYKNMFEVARFCTALNTVVAGALSKLLKAARSWAQAQGALKLMTYVDRRVGNGSGYVKAGFVKVGETVPRYWYTDTNVRYDRFKFRAQPGKSEKQVALEAGVVKIYGCPNLVLSYELK